MSKDTPKDSSNTDSKSKSSIDEFNPNLDTVGDKPASLNDDARAANQNPSARESGGAAQAKEEGLTKTGPGILEGDEGVTDKYGMKIREVDNNHKATAKKD